MSISSDFYDYAEIIPSEAIVFTNEEELSKYNEALLNQFVSYLNKKHKKTKDVFVCSASIQISPDENLVKNFNKCVMQHITK